MRMASIAGAAALLFALSGAANAQQLPLVVDNIDLANPQLVDGVLTATAGTVSGTLAGLPFKTDITDFALNLSPSDSATCAILNLELAPINLKLLGLHVDTSRICLDIIAIPNGGLLGNLLCNLAGLDLGGILSGLLGDLPVLGNSLLGTIVEQVLGGALNNSQPAAQAPGQGQGGGGGGDSVCTGDCDILDLVLGPVDLTLLGLNVVLDDCAGSPVEVCVSATRSEGILGGLLCSLAGPQLSGLGLGSISQLVGLAQGLLQDGALSNPDVKQLRQLLKQIL